MDRSVAVNRNAVPRLMPAPTRGLGERLGLGEVPGRRAPKGRQHDREEKVVVVAGVVRRQDERTVVWYVFQPLDAREMAGDAVAYQRPGQGPYQAVAAPGRQDAIF